MVSNPEFNRYWEALQNMQLTFECIADKVESEMEGEISLKRLTQTVVTYTIFSHRSWSTNAVASLVWSFVTIY